MTKMLEREIEKKVKDYAKSKGWLTYKWVSPQNRGVPDSIFIKDGNVVFIEFKAPGKKPTKLQQKTIDAMLAQDCFVYVADSVEGATAVLDFLDIKG